MSFLLFLLTGNLPVQPVRQIALNEFGNWRGETLTVHEGVAYFQSLDGLTLFGLDLSQDSAKPQAVYQSSGKGDSQLVMVGKNSDGLYIRDLALEEQATKSSIVTPSVLHLTWNGSRGSSVKEIKPETLPYSIIERNGKTTISTRWPKTEALEVVFDTDRSFTKSTPFRMQRGSKLMSEVDLESRQYDARFTETSPAYKLKATQDDGFLALDKNRGVLFVYSSEGDVIASFDINQVPKYSIGTQVMIRDAVKVGDELWISINSPKPQMVYMDMKTGKFRTVDLTRSVRAFDIDEGHLYIATGGFLQVYKM